MKVVFDTNIFISALVFPGSVAEKAIFKIIEGEDILLISKQILKEILSVLSKKFSGDKEAISRVAVNLSEIAEMVNPTVRIRVLKDEPDNRMLAPRLHKLPNGGLPISLIGKKPKGNRFRGNKISGYSLWPSQIPCQQLFSSLHMPLRDH